MCGIVSVIRYANSREDKENFLEMTNCLKHRGPDAIQTYMHKNVQLGHARLAIQDKSDLANQPIHSFDENYVLIFNGEIYNSKELKLALKKKGKKFNTTSDTEILLESLIVWGKSVIPILNGMFAFIFYDKKENKVIVARDRYGIKPLYFSLINGNLIFSSEQKSIRKHKDFQSKIDTVSLNDYLTFQNILGNRTLEENIKIIPAGNFLEFSTEKSQELYFSEYWDFDYQTNVNVKSQEEKISQLDHILDEAVKLQLVADVNKGAYLSGGIDSSLIALYAAKTERNLSTFSIGFEDNFESNSMFLDETEQASLFASRLKITNISDFVSSADLESSLKEIVWHLEEPRVGQSYPNYFAAKLAKRHVGIVLSGTGGDELFGGYTWRYEKLIRGIEKNEFLENYFKIWHKLLNPEDLADLIRPLTKYTNGHTGIDSMKAVLSKYDLRSSSLSDHLNMAWYFDSKTFLHGLLLVDDKLNMAFGLESRVPFLDNNVVDFAMKLGINDKISIHNGGMHNSEVCNQLNQIDFGKKILRQLLSRKTGHNYMHTPKQGFSGPDSSWFRKANREFVLSLLKSKNAKIYEFIDFSTAQRLLDDHMSGKRELRSFIWSLMYLEMYFATFR